MSKILMVASEAAPFVKTGGLADVLGALPRALAERGEEVAVVLPRYGSVALEGARRVYDYLNVWLGPDRYYTDIYLAVEGGVSYYLVECPGLYERDGIYAANGADYPDNHIRFAVLSLAALGIVRYLFRPQIIHCHDWQTGLTGPYARHKLGDDPTFLGIKFVFTIHNLGYPGRFRREQLGEMGLDDSLFLPLSHFGDISFLKGGIHFADAITTVSKGYAREIQTPEYGFGFERLLRSRSSTLTGILNGANYREWNPEHDTHIAANYSAEDLSGKRRCKRALLEELGLPADKLDRPLIGIISRLVDQKGFDLVARISRELVSEDLFLVALGTGEQKYEELFRRLAADHPDKVSVRIAHDEELAHKIQAGADIFLMPSRYEPCGLTQMYSLRYGTVPVVRAVGGLDDTVDSSTGSKFSEYSGEALLATIRAALLAFQDREQWEAMMRRGMRKDFSWRRPAAEYSALYRRLTGA
jgi:starch synthase